MPTEVFAGSRANSTWTGTIWTEDEMMVMSSDITERSLDLAFESDVAEKLRDLAMTGAETQWLTEFLEGAVSHEVLPWQVGEAIAEVILEKDYQIIFPSNARRDERNPRASLAGADLVGISVRPGGCQLVFGEVKSSSDAKSPPSVVTGKSGMNQQLERLISDDTLRFALIKWLYARICEETSSSFDEALAAFVSTSGTSVRLVGVLVRDTSPNEADVSNRDRTLGAKVSTPGSVEFHAMYMPRPMAEWVEWVAA